MIVTILCGGSGTRLWPLSREMLPKQFVKLIGEDSLFQKTLRRNKTLADKFHIITNQSHYFLAQNEIEAINDESKSYKYILESIPKNTAVALLFSALIADSEDIILAIPSDHIIKDEENYINAVALAQNLANAGNIVLFGIKPSCAHTGYGYIKDNGRYIEFIEKPNKQNAQQYLRDGNYYWNSGMFCFKASVLIDEFQTYQNEILSKAQKAINNANKESSFIRLRYEDMEDMQSISIDYAIMEKSKKLKLIKADFKWNDVGSFDSIKEEFVSDCNGNKSNSNLIAIDSTNNLIISDKLTATIGINDLIVVDTRDSLLIAKEGESQKIKDIVEILKCKNSDLCKFHNTAYRPWGSYSVLLEGNNYKIKQIIVKPKKRLSLQKHFHRNEHWIVVSGSAIVTINDKEFMLKSNQSTYIPMGEVHRLANPGKIDLVMIEVQMGEYLGEDDIVRIEDDFSRN